MSGRTAREILASDEFRALAQCKHRGSGALTVAQALVYLAFLALVAFGGPLLAAPLGPGRGTTWGIALAALVIVASWALTGAYVLWANRRCDALVRRVRDGIRG